MEQPPRDFVCLGSRHHHGYAGLVGSGLHYGYAYLLVVESVWCFEEVLKRRLGLLSLCSALLRRCDTVIFRLRLLYSASGSYMRQSTQYIVT